MPKLPVGIKGTLSLRTLINLWNAMYPPIYFATDRNLEKGKYYKIRKKDLSFVPRIYDVDIAVFHPYHLEELATILPNKLIHIRDYGKLENKDEK